MNDDVLFIDIEEDYPLTIRDVDAFVAALITLVEIAEEGEDWDGTMGNRLDAIKVIREALGDG